MKQCVQNYSGSVLNAIRDRKNDYFKVLFALAPVSDDDSNDFAEIILLSIFETGL